jgi:hypothetical protein
MSIKGAITTMEDKKLVGADLQGQAHDHNPRAGS